MIIDVVTPEDLAPEDIESGASPSAPCAGSRRWSSSSSFLSEGEV